MDRQTTEELEHIEQVAALDNDIPAETPGVAPEPQQDPVHKLPKQPSQYVVVWTHLLTEPHHWANAVAQVLPNGTLLIHQRGKSVPVKGYAPGGWTEFEHVGEYPAPESRPTVDDYNRQKQTSDGGVRRAARPENPMPPGTEITRIQDSVTVRLPQSDDTQEVPVVREDSESPAGGGVSPKAPAGLSESPSGTASPVRRRTADLGIPAPLSDLNEEPIGPLRALWRSLWAAPPAE